MVKHECDESAADAILVQRGSQCDYCGFEAAMTDGGVVKPTVNNLMPEANASAD
jgi:hypothetical protein